MKKLLLIVLLFIGFNGIAQIPLASYISTIGPTDTYPTHLDSLGAGGYTTTYNYTTRNAIPVARRKIGMMAHYIASDSTFILIGGIANSNWVYKSLTGGGTWGSITGTLSAQTDLQTALNGKANVNSQVFTGTPSLPTGTTAVLQATGNSTTAIATTSFVQQELTNNAVNFLSGTFLGSGTTGAPYYLNVSTTPTSGSNLPITSNGVFGALANYALLISPSFTGTPTAPTATVGTNTTQIATTAFVLANGGGVPSSFPSNQVLNTNGYTLTVNGNSSGAGGNPPGLIIKDPANALYTTYLGMVGGLPTGELMLGGNSVNYIVAGTGTVGGSLKFYVNNTNAAGIGPNGIDAMDINNMGQVIMNDGLSVTGAIATTSLQANNITLTPASGPYIQSTSTGTAFNYQDIINGAGTTYIGTANSSGAGFFTTGSAYEMTLTTAYAGDLGFGTNLVENARNFSSGNWAFQHGGTFTDKGTTLQTDAFATAINTSNKTTTYTIIATDHTITADASVSAYTVTLPTAVGCQGREYIIKKVDATANTLTVGTTSSQTIDGSTTYPLTAQYQFIKVQSNNANWVVISSNASSGGGGSGTVTSITPGVGFLSHTAITVSGTMNIDTAGTIGSKTWAFAAFNTKAQDAALYQPIGSYALQATTISAGYGMAGGGSLSANRTLTADTTLLKSKAGFLTDYNNLSGRITTNTTNIATNTASIATKEGLLTLTAVKTANYTLSPYDIAVGDVTSGTFTFTLPNAPADGTLVEVKMNGQTGTNAISLAVQGVDVFNGGGTTASLVQNFQAITFKYKLSNHTWYSTSTNLALGLLDTRYLLFANQGTATTVYHGNATGNGSFGSIVNSDIAAGTIDLTAKVTGLLPDANISSAANWNTAYTNRITSLTTTGSSGASTLTANVLNIPTYTLSGLGGFPNPMTNNGDIIYGGTSGVATRLGIGSTGNPLTVIGGIPGYSNLVLTNPASAATFTLAAGKTFTENNTFTINATDGITMTTPTTSFTAARTDAANTFTGHQTIEGVTSTGATGTGNIVFSAAPTFTGTAIFSGATVTTLSASSLALTGSNSSNNLNIPNATNGQQTATAMFQLNGATSTRYRVGIGGTAYTISANDAATNFLVAGTTTTTASSGTSPMLASMALTAPAYVISTGATATWAATLDIDGPATTSGAGTLTNAALSLLVRTGNSFFGGNITLGTIGNGIAIKEGTNASMGQGTLAAGTLVISNTRVTANSRIFLTDEGGGVVANIGSLYISARTAGTSFTVSSSNALDTSTFSWIIIEPAP